MTFPITETVSTIAALFSAAAAGVALRISRQANATATSVARIEQARWHRDQTPDITATCVIPEGYVGRARLTLTLNGPTPLDKVTVTIRNDSLRGPSLGYMSPEQEEEFRQIIWGRWRFGQYIEAAPGRRSADFKQLPVDEPKTYWLDETTAPSWRTREDWRREYADAPLRLIIECHRDGHEPWVLKREVRVTSG